MSKLEGGMQELEETGYWLELILESKAADAASVTPLLSEANELMSIFVSIVRKRKK